jgi:uncharacterized protein
MLRSTKSFLFPDLNVWIALTYRGHVHYTQARAWLDSLPEATLLCFCRFTQLGFLRLLTTSAVMADRVLSQAEAWRVYDQWLEKGQAIFVEEPPSLEPVCRSLSQSARPTPKDWGDSYLAAFAEASRLSLVTFDQALQRKASGAVLLKPTL